MADSGSSYWRLHSCPAALAGVYNDILLVSFAIVTAPAFSTRCILENLLEHIRITAQPIVYI
jgi:hypothetical protein